MKRTAPKGYIRTSGRILKQPAKSPPKTMWSGVRRVGETK